jgi:uroporphyrinogen-III synthase
MEPVLLPVSRCRLDAGAVEKALGRPWSGVAVTSGQAVRALIAAHGAVEALDRLPVFAVGNRTAEAARTAGFHDLRVGPGRGDGLAAIVAAAVAKSASAPLLYCAGDPRAPEFEAQLDTAGVRYETVVCYHMEAVAYRSDELDRVFSADCPPVVLLYSRETAVRFFRLAAGYDLRPTMVLCLSRNVAEAVPDRFAGLAATAREATEEALLEKLATVQT